MRIDRALENIRAVMESQEIDWLNNNGYDPVPHKAEPRRPSAPKKALSGHFAANRFLGTAPIEPEEPAVHEPMEAEIESPVNEPEFIEVIKQKDNKHSWLYNEVVKAIRDAAGDSKNTKVIAIFVPVVQNSKEFENLPVSETIELSPVDEDAVKLGKLPDVPEELPDIPEDSPELEPAEHVDEILPEPIHEPDPELAQAFIEMEAKLDEAIAAEPEPEAAEEIPESEEVHEEEMESLPEVEAESESESSESDEVPMMESESLEIPESESEQEQGTAVTEIPMPDELDDDELAEELEEKND